MSVGAKKGNRPCGLLRQGCSCVKKRQDGFLRPTFGLGSCSDLFRRLRFGLWPFFRAHFRIGLYVLRFFDVLLSLFLYEQYRFLFFNALVALLVDLVVSVPDCGEFLGHVFLGEVEQEGGNGVTAVCTLEVGNQKITTDKVFFAWP